MLEYQEAMDIIEVAVKKQLPKKVIVVCKDKTDEPIDLRCPICNASVMLSGIYCGRCGQYLDLEEVTGAPSL